MEEVVGRLTVSQLGVVDIHRIKAISILHPILAVWRLRGSSIGSDVLKDQVGAVHDVQRPKRRIFDIEVRDGHV